MKAKKMFAILLSCLIVISVPNLTVIATENEILNEFIAADGVSSEPEQINGDITEDLEEKIDLTIGGEKDNLLNTSNINLMANPGSSVTVYIDGGEITFDASGGTITGYLGNPTYLNIPDKIGDAIVTGIDDFVFAGSSLTYITIPSTVTSIGFGAFIGIDNLKIRCMENSAAYTYAIENDITTELLGTVVNGMGIIFNKETNTITGYTGNTDNLVIPSQIFGIDVKNIEYNAFGSCSSLTRVEIPASVDNISQYAFGWCENLTEVIIHNGNMQSYNAFQYCNNLTRVIFAEGVTEIKNSIGLSLISNLSEIILPETLITIGESAVSSCRNLQTINLTESLETIGNNAFSGCEKLTNIILPSSVTSMGYNAFASCTILNESIVENLPASITVIPSSAFTDCEAFENIVIPDTVTKIEYSAFSGCDNLKSVILSENLKEISDQAFAYCNGLTSVEVPASVDTLSQNVFYSCENLAEVILHNGSMQSYNSFQYCNNLAKVIFAEGITEIKSSIGLSSIANLSEIVLPETLITIGESAVSSCRNLTIINLPESLETIGNNTFSGCEKLTDIILPVGITSIGYNAFSGCTILNESIVENLPAGITVIPSSAFADCEAFENIIIPDTVTKIDSSAFSGCDNLKSVILSENLKEISDQAFAYCNGLTSVEIPASVDTLSQNVFYSCENLAEVILHNGSMQSYNSFQYCDNLKKVIFAEGITEIKSSIGLRAITNLSEVVLPETLISIGEITFNSCNNLPTINLPESLETIGNNAFSGCEKLTDIILPANVTSIGYSVFSNCKLLNETIIENLPASITVIPSSAFTDCEAFENIVIPDTVTKIEYSAFSGCDNLKSIILSENLKEISDQAFAYCNGLTSVEIPASVDTLSQNVFYSCENLAEVILHNGSMQSYNSFQYCDNLKKVIFAEGITEIKNSIGLYSITNLDKVYIPKSVTAIEDSVIPYTQQWTDGTYEESYTVTIYCYNLSYAHSYAVLKGIPFVILDEVITSVEEFSDIHVPYNATQAEILVVLPTTATVYLDTNITISLPISWSLKEGEPYKYIGTVSLSEYISNASNLTTTINVIVDPKPIIYYTVTFLANGDVISIQEVEDGTSAFAPDDVPYVDNYTFTGWDNDFTTITSAITVNAVYTPNTYIITYILDGGTNTEDAATSYIYGTSVTLPTNPTKTGYTFGGWYKDDKFITGTVVTTIATTDYGNKSYYAKWNINSYTVKFMADGTEIASVSVNHGSDATAPENIPEKTGHTFTSWDKEFSNITSDLTVTAIYTENPLVITGVTDDIQIPVIPYNASNEQITSLLPKTATVIMSNGARTETAVKTVTWEWSKDGKIYTFTGTIEGYTFTRTANEEEEPLVEQNITVSSLTAKSGDTVTVSIDVSNEISMAMGTLLINYDRTKLTAVSYEFGEAADGANGFANLNFNDKDGNKKIKATFVNAINISGGGNLLTITFKLADGLSNNEIIPVTLEIAELRNENETVIPLNITNGNIKVLNYTLGDVNNDGFVNLTDALRILRYDVGLTALTANEKLAANVNKDAKINVLDSLIIQQFDLGIIKNLE